MSDTAMPMSASSPQEQILGIVNNYWQGCCVGAAAQLEIADLLADGPLSVDALAQRTKTHTPSLELEAIGPTASPLNIIVGRVRA